MTNKIIPLQQTATIAELLKWNSQWETHKQDIKFLTNKEDVGRMRQFYNNNGIRIKSAIEKLNDLAKKYCEFDGEIPRTEIKDGKWVSIFKQDMTEGDYMKERNEILAQEVPVVI